MVRLKGILKHRLNKKTGIWSGDIKEDREGGNRYNSGLKEFELKEEWRGQPCEFELNETFKIIAIWVDGKPVPKNEGIAKQKKEGEKAKAERIKQREEEQQRQEALERAQQGGVYHPALAPFLPKDVTVEMESLPNGPDNYSLKLNQTANWEGEKAILFRATRDSNNKHQYVPAANYGFPEEIWNELQTKLTSQATAISAAFEQFSLEQDAGARLAIGLGTATVFETGILLHPVYGFPYLPATSQKGITRSWIIDCCFEGEEERALMNPSFILMFGSTDQRGSLIFFDAFPTHAPTIKEDIMNPHYPKYYTGEEPPADYQSPVPIPFLTVENTTFQFLLGLKPLKGLEDAKVSGPIATHLGANDGELSLLQAGKQWLLKALTEHGIGAKTSLGYGFFSAP